MAKISEKTKRALAKLNPELIRIDDTNITNLEIHSGPPRYFEARMLVLDEVLLNKLIKTMLTLEYCSLSWRGYTLMGNVKSITLGSPGLVAEAIIIGNF